MATSRESRFRSAKKKTPARNKSPAQKRAPRRTKLTAALAEAAWTEADAALAEALVEFDLLAQAANRAARAEAMTILGLALSRAARRRGLTRVGMTDALEPFDAKRHARARSTGRAPRTVLILIPGVARGDEVLMKARVAGSRARRR